MIYADNAATTKISETVFVEMLPFLQEKYGNPSSQYSLGVKTKRAIERARKQVAFAIGAETAEITFTSCGSEANSWVFHSVGETFGYESFHLITTSIEHHSVLNSCRALEAKGVKVTYLPVDCVGRVSVAAVKAAIEPNTKLVSLMLANNEIGTVQPIKEIGKYLRKRNILFHTDAVQAVGHIPVDVKDLQVDFLSASAHKFNGAKGTGILYQRSGVNLARFVFGGEQEHGNRAGTENVAGIVAAGFALEESVAAMPEITKRMQKMVKLTVEGLRAKIPGVRINGDTKNRLPGIINLGIDGVSGEALMHLLDLKGICVSTGSACRTGIDQPSHVLKALGLSEKQAKSAIRISYGKYNTIEEADAIVNSICDAFSKIARTKN